LFHYSNIPVEVIDKPAARGPGNKQRSNFFPQRRRGAEEIFFDRIYRIFRISDSFASARRNFWFRILILLILFILSKKLFRCFRLFRMLKIEVIGKRAAQGTGNKRMSNLWELRIDKARDKVRDKD
jgi:hypothetical protein